MIGAKFTPEKGGMAPHKPKRCNLCKEVVEVFISMPRDEVMNRWTGGGREAFNPNKANGTCTQRHPSYSW